MRTGGGGTRPADAGPATCSCSGGHHRLLHCLRRTPAVRTPTVRTPTFWTPTAVLGAAADSQGVRGVRFHRHPDTGRRSGWGRTAADPQPPLRHHGRTAQVGFARLCWSSGQVDAARGERLSGCLDTGRGLANTGSRHGPARRTPATAAGHGDTAASGHAGQPAAGPSTTPAAMSDRNGTPSAVPASTPG
jgi:hypothetical protein